MLLIALFFGGAISIMGQTKREFRGAWIQAVNGQFRGLSKEEMQATLSSQLDELERDGVNAIIFQVRVECDALYQSDLEPWSRYLTGTQGRSPGWDPLAWMVSECHKRGMELHAWINPFRAKVKDAATLANTHICLQKPGSWFEYDGLYILNPGIPENRDYICSIAKDIVSRYDIDGFHIDDYFYPYPAAGKEIDDSRQFALYNNGFRDIRDWRRDNVNLFIKQLSETVHETKAWVKFGVSPFGIYRNKKNDPLNGSATNGLQNYDDLYADILLWVNNGWLDYCVPQLYWEIGNKAADYDELIRWWNRYSANTLLYIGEDIERTAKYPDPVNSKTNQMDAKFRLHAQMANVHGTVLWYAKLAADDYGSYGTMLRKKYWRYPALQPLTRQLAAKAPGKVKSLKPVWTADGYVLCWTAPKGKTWQDKAVKYVVYRFDKNEEINLNNPAKIVAVVDEPFCPLPYSSGKTTYNYVVTALNRVQSEGIAVKKKIKL